MKRAMQRLLLLALLVVAPGCGLLRTPPPRYDTVRTDTGLIVRDLVVPESGEEVRAGDRVTLEFTLSLQDGTLLESSLEDGRPLTVEVGAGQVPAGLDEGLVGMRRFGRRLLVVPPELAFGETGAPPDIPPSATLRFEVEVMEIEAATP